MTEHECDSGWFDRTVCGCGAMHSYCDTCGKRDDDCPLDAEEATPAIHQRPASTEVDPSATATPVGPHRANLDVEAIRVRMEAATPGPWQSVEIAHTNWIGFYEPAGFFRLYERRAWATPADDDFVAAARSDIPALLAELDRLTAALDAERARVAAGLAVINGRHPMPYCAADGRIVVDLLGRVRAALADPDAEVGK
ncbi:hypothetical protein [Nocardioides sp. WS12]|uniref:hypothetical protein n=1 Tax=Nocardioides sp. WS12 TaxID=2486272 RepID=UPI0015FDA3C6|nr:hypothetical protein [Nocardioides sp. WS12]